VLHYGIYGVCIGILACRGLSLVSSPLHAMKLQSQIQSSAAVNLGLKLLSPKVPTLSLHKAKQIMVALFGSLSQPRAIMVVGASNPIVIADKDGYFTEKVK
ncbi:hypothetical protein Tco_0197469, partial [Tanacetum coccineum]